MNDIKGPQYFYDNVTPTYRISRDKKIMNNVNNAQAEQFEAVE